MNFRKEIKFRKKGWDLRSNKELRDWKYMGLSIDYIK